MSAAFAAVDPASNARAAPVSNKVRMDELPVRTPSGAYEASNNMAEIRPLRSCPRTRASSSWLWVPASAGTSGALSPGLSVSPGSRRLDDKRFPGVDHGRVAAFELFDRVIPAAHGILSHLTVFAT